MITRRLFIAGSLVVDPLFRASAAEANANLKARFAELETRVGGRLGVSALDVATGRLIGNRANERFAMCSTFKALAAAFVLARVDRGEERLDRRITFTQEELVPPHFATESHVGPSGMTIAELCEAAVTVSDSTAANLMLASFGGPVALTAYLRALGDSVTRLDRVELDLNRVDPGDFRDTTSPAAMMKNLRELILADALSTASRSLMIGWMTDARDAATRRLRAGLPPGWRIANKPGTWEGVATNDVGVIWPPRRGPLVIAAFLGESSAPAKTQESLLAEVARMVVEVLEG